MIDSTNQEKSKQEEKQFFICPELLAKPVTKKELVAGMWANGPINARALIGAGIPKRTAYKLLQNMPERQKPGKLAPAPLPIMALKALRAVSELTCWLLVKIAAASNDGTGISIGKLCTLTGRTGYEIKRRLSEQKACHVVINGHLLRLTGGHGGLYLPDGRAALASEKGKAATAKATAAAMMETAKAKRAATMAARAKARATFLATTSDPEPIINSYVTDDIEATTRRKMAAKAKDRAATMEAAANAGLDCEWLAKALDKLNENEPESLKEPKQEEFITIAETSKPENKAKAKPVAKFLDIKTGHFIPFNGFPNDWPRGDLKALIPYLAKLPRPDGWREDRPLEELWGDVIELAKYPGIMAKTIYKPDYKELIIDAGKPVYVRPYDLLTGNF